VRLRRREKRERETAMIFSLLQSVPNPRLAVNHNEEMSRRLSVNGNEEKRRSHQKEKRMNSRARWLRRRKTI
jgi:hypothetical protein